MTFDALTFGKQLAEARKAKEWSLDDLAFALRGKGVTVSREYLRQLEAGKAPAPRVDLADAICAVMGVEAGAFLLAG